MNIHPSAILGPKVVVDPSATIGPYCVITGDVHIGAGTTIGPHVVIEGKTRIGANCHIFQGVSLGLPPQDKSYAGEETELTIGDEVTIREFVTISRGTPTGGGHTQVGDRCYLMAYVHIGHDCVLAEEVIMANGATLGGHVSVGRKANLSAYFLVHQHCSIGELCMVGGMSGARKSLPPFVMVDGRNSLIHSINKVGLSRDGFSRECIKQVDASYRLIRSKPNAEAFAEIELMAQEFPPLQKIVDFYRNSKRGVVSFLTRDLPKD